MRITTHHILFMILAFLYSCDNKIGENKKSNSIEGNKSFIGISIVASDEDGVPLLEKDIKSRFTPSSKDVEEAEKILKNNIREFISTDSIGVFFGAKEAMFTDSLDNYMRQYAGFVNLDNEKEILINFLWYSSILQFDSLLEIDSEEDGKTEWIRFSDGGDHFWRIKVNLDQRKLHDWDVNGEA